MAFAPKALADGQLPNSASAIFTATATIATYVKKLTLFNTNAATQTIILYINYTGTNRAFRRFVLEQYESVDALDGAEAILLESGDSIQAITTTASAVDYTMSGVEESA